jgi:hypothetical protein
MPYLHGQRAIVVRFENIRAVGIISRDDYLSDWLSIAISAGVSALSLEFRKSLGLFGSVSRFRHDAEVLDMRFVC